jgi:putative ATP-binding cassette transporter
VLERLGLRRLAPSLDDSRHRDTMLSDGGLQTPAFARALLHEPAWLIVHEALDALDTETMSKVIEVLSTELARCGVLYIGRAGAHDGSFRRTLHLVDGASPDGGVVAATNPGIASPA